MDKLFRYFHAIRSANPDLSDEISEIMGEHATPENGITIAELKEVYQERYEKKFPIRFGPIVVTEFLLTVPNTAVYCNTNGTLYFYSIA